VRVRVCVRAGLRVHIHTHTQSSFSLDFGGRLALLCLHLLLSERAFSGFLAIFLVAQLPPKKTCFGTEEFSRFLSTVSSQLRATHSDLSSQTK